MSFRKRVGSEFIGFTYKEALHAVDRTTAGFLRAGLKRGDRVLFLCDPTPLWIIVDCAIITAGGVSVPRGTDTTDEEILHIAQHSQSRFAVVQNPKTAVRIRALAKNLPDLRYLIIMEDDKGNHIEGRSTLSLLQEKGDRALANRPTLIEDVLRLSKEESVAAIIYTSGTTGRPKGV
ncbi:MAG: AMP-binding protein, partial [Spirochaetia bacterium]|nr:AMP-binding protein [Spirochaetia bacterium]